MLTLAQPSTEMHALMPKFTRPRLSGLGQTADEDITILKVTMEAVSPGLLEKLQKFQRGELPESAFTTDELGIAIEFSKQYLAIEPSKDIEITMSYLQKELERRRKRKPWMTGAIIAGGVVVAAAAGYGIYRWTR